MHLALQAILTEEVKLLNILIPIPFLIVSSFTDIKARKIKNYTTLPMIALGLVYWAFKGGINGFMGSCLAMLFLGLLIAIMPGMNCGGGDIKLMAGCGAWVGNLLSAFQLFVLVIGISSLVMLVGIIYKNGIKQTVLNMKLEILSMCAIKTGNIGIPMAPIIMVSFFIWIYLYQPILIYF
jgi:Flp pilus assembly protein protease CpaA